METRFTGKAQTCSLWEWRNRSFIHSFMPPTIWLLLPGMYYSYLDLGWNLVSHFLCEPLNFPGPVFSLTKWNCLASSEISLKASYACCASHCFRHSLPGRDEHDTYTACGFCASCSQHSKCLWGFCSYSEFSNVDLKQKEFHNIQLSLSRGNLIGHISDWAHVRSTLCHWTTFASLLGPH